MSIPIKMMLEWLTHENAQLNRQVTDLQARGTELVEENRELKRRLAKYEQEALTAERWAEVLQALSPETQDGITDALKAARDLAALHELIQEQSGLDEHHPNYSPEWAVRQMSERWGAEISARIVAERELADMRGRLYALAGDTAGDVVTRIDRALADMRRERDEARAEMATTKQALEEARATKFDRSGPEWAGATREVAGAADSTSAGAPTIDPEAPATRREVEELMREMLTTLAEVCAGADEHAQAPWPWPLTRLAQELRRRVEKLEAERAR